MNNIYERYTQEELENRIYKLKRRISTYSYYIQENLKEIEEIKKRNENWCMKIDKANKTIELLTNIINSKKQNN